MIKGHCRAQQCWGLSPLSYWPIGSLGQNAAQRMNPVKWLASVAFLISARWVKKNVFRLKYFFHNRRPWMRCKLLRAKKEPVYIKPVSRDFIQPKGGRPVVLPARERIFRVTRNPVVLRRGLKHSLAVYPTSCAAQWTFSWGSIVNPACLSAPSNRPAINIAIWEEDSFVISGTARKGVAFVFLLWCQLARCRCFEKQCSFSRKLRISKFTCSNYSRTR